MKLKNLQIRHKEYWRDAPPTSEKYDGNIEFFNEKGEALKIVLTEEQMAGIVQICAAAIIAATQQAAASIVASLNTQLQVNDAEYSTPLDGHTASSVLLSGQEVA